ncbi:MAG: PHP domain-containing protein, partial [Candidatus Acidiferrum sp.]
MFVHLRCHSHYSFLRGLNPPEEIIAAAAEQKMPAVALTDTNGMYAAVPFYQKAQEAGLKPIVGVVLDVETGGERRVTNGGLRRAKNETRNSPSVSIVLLAADAAGYSNLCRLTTLRHLGALQLGQETFVEGDGRPVTLEELAAHSAGVVALWPASALLRMDLARRGAACCAP